MNTPLDKNNRFDVLEQKVLAILQQHPAGTSEHDLIEQLGSDGVEGFEGRVCGDELTMFQTHFILFHCLYRLRERLHQQFAQGLEIHCLKIRLHPLHADNGPNLPGQHDPLRDYYLDLSNLENTTQADVSNLLDSFWQRFLAADHRHTALQVLGLSDNADYNEIRVQYKRLVMEHHPDRGGDKIKLQSINEAMEQLRAYYN